jgi:hypothetical protein
VALSARARSARPGDPASADALIGDKANPNGSPPDRRPRARAAADPDEQGALPRASARFQKLKTGPARPSEEATRLAPPRFSFRSVTWITADDAQSRYATINDLKGIGP